MRKNISVSMPSVDGVRSVVNASTRDVDAYLFVHTDDDGGTIYSIHIRSTKVIPIMQAVTKFLAELGKLLTISGG